MNDTRSVGSLNLNQPYWTKVARASECLRSWVWWKKPWGNCFLGTPVWAGCSQGILSECSPLYPWVCHGCGLADFWVAPEASSLLYLCKVLSFSSLTATCWCTWFPFYSLQTMCFFSFIIYSLIRDYRLIFSKNRNITFGYDDKLTISGFQCKWW